MKMKNKFYYLEYQLEDSEPDNHVLKAESQEKAIEKTIKKIERELYNQAYLQKDEVDELVKTIFWIDVRLVKP